MQLCQVYDGWIALESGPSHYDCGDPVGWHPPVPNCANDLAPLSFGEA
jgi:hypothetical protein